MRTYRDTVTVQARDDKEQGDLLNLKKNYNNVRYSLTLQYMLDKLTSLGYETL
jgi:hypothetical protein